MERRTIGKRLGSVLLTLAMVITMTVTALPVFAGDGIAEVTYKPAADGKVTTTFSLYKVGHFERAEDGTSYLALDSGIPDVGEGGAAVDVSIKKSDYADADGNVDETPDGEWTKAWQASAAALASVIESTGITPVTAEANAGNNGVATFTGLDDGLYLVTGTPHQKYMDTATGITTYYTPSASFVMVLSGKAALEVKYETEVVREYVLKKAWVIPEKYESLRPESVDIQIYRRVTEDGDWVKYNPETETEDPVTLSDDNYWTIEWSSDPDYAWKWEELMSDSEKIHFIVNDDGGVLNKQDNKKYITITNTYTKRQLELTKILKHFLENGDNAATFAFEIRGYMGTGDDERLVYTASAGINFAKDNIGSLTKLVDNIPVNLTRLEVEEVYSGDYAVTDPNKKIQDAELVDRGEELPPIYTVEFENDFNDDITISGGIVNTYTNEEGEIVLKPENKDYGKVPAGAQER